MIDETRKFAQHIMKDMREFRQWRWGPFLAQSYCGVSGRQWQITFGLFGFGFSVFYFENNQNDGTRQTEGT